MQMLYNSDSFAVMQFDVPAPADRGGPGVPTPDGDRLTRGGYEIVDKFARKEIFLQGVLAQQFQEGVQRIVEGGPTEEAMDEFIARYTALAQQPVVMH